MDLYTFEYDVWLRGFQPLLNDPIPAHGHRPLSYQSSRQSVGGGPLRGCTELELAIFQYAHQRNNVSTGVLSLRALKRILADGNGRRMSMPQNARNIDATAIPLSEINVSNPQLYADDTWGQLFARLRREAPVHYCRKSAYGPYWSVTRYNDIMAVELDHARFSSSSEHGGIQIADLPPGAQYGNFIRMDPPRHTAQRKTVAPIATPTHVAKLEGLIRERTAKVLDELPRNETFDWVDKVSIELITMMLATLFDFPWEDRRLLPYWSDVAVANLDAPDSPVKTQAERAAELARMGRYFAELFEESAGRPPTVDLISMMVHSEAMRTQPKHEFIGNLVLLIVGGNDTTRNTMTGGLLALHENPGEWAKLRADPGLVPSLVHETIRFQTPVIHMRRSATRAP